MAPVKHPLQCKQCGKVTDHLLDGAERVDGADRRRFVCLPCGTTHLEKK